MTFLPVIVQLLLLAVVAVAGFYDLRFRRIPNWLALIGLVVGIGLNSFLFEWAGFQRALLGMGLSLLVYFPLYLLRAMGAGDAKLMAAVGSMLGWQNWIMLFIVTAILGGVSAIVVLLFAGRVRKTFWNVGWILHEITHLRAPYQSSEEL